MEKCFFLKIIFLIVSCKLQLSDCRNHTFWVTPMTGQNCHNRTPCNTTVEYYQQNNSIFSTSNSTWIFLNGTHEFKTNMGVISSAEHVTFKGEYPDCCLVHIRTIRVWVYLNHGQFIGFENLHFAADSDIYTWTRFIVVNNTNGLTFSNVRFQGGNIHLIDSYIEIWNCSFNCTNMRLESVTSEIIDKNTRLSVNYNKTHFKDSIIFITIASEENAVVAMHGCTLKRSDLKVNSFFSHNEL